MPGSPSVPQRPLQLAFPSLHRPLQACLHKQLTPCCLPLQEQTRLGGSASGLAVAPSPLAPAATTSPRVFQKTENLPSQSQAVCTAHSPRYSHLAVTRANSTETIQGREGGVVGSSSQFQAQCILAVGEWSSWSHYTQTERHEISVSFSIVLSLRL